MATKNKTRVSKQAKKKQFQFKWWMGVVIAVIVALVGILVLRSSFASTDSSAQRSADKNSAARKQANEVAFERIRLDRQYNADKGDKGAAAAVPQKLTASQLSDVSVKAKATADAKTLVGNATAAVDQTQVAMSDAPTKLKQAEAQQTPAQAKEKAPLVAPPPTTKPADYPVLPSASSDQAHTIALINDLVPTAQAYGYFNAQAVNAGFYTVGWNKYAFGFPGNNIPWCNLYIMWIAASVGKPIAGYPFVYSGTTASIMYGQGRLFSPGYFVPEPGDLVWFNWDLAGERFDHIAMVGAVRSDFKGGYQIATLNGNWGGSNNDNSSVQYVGWYDWKDWRITAYADWFGY